MDRIKSVEVRSGTRYFLDGVKLSQRRRVELQMPEHPDAVDGWVAGRFTFQGSTCWFTPDGEDSIEIGPQEIFRFPKR